MCPSHPKQKPRPMTFSPESQAKAGPASKTLERALKLYDAEDYTMSTIELNKVVEGQSGDDEANKQRAEFYMGKALFNMKYYSASLSYFDRIVQKGPAHRYYQKTLQWLASLSRFLPESAGVLEKIGKQVGYRRSPNGRTTSGMGLGAFLSRSLLETQNMSLQWRREDSDGCCIVAAIDIKGVTS